MKTRNHLLAAGALILAGCAAYEGLYAPSCIAFAGSEIRLEDGRYVWSKFTDQVEIDADGNEVDPFPGFPRRGKYEKQDYEITLLGAGGEPVHTLFLFRLNGDIYLYTAAEAEAFEGSGERPACPLKLQPAETIQYPQTSGK